MNKFECFTENAKLLQEKYDIIPLLYGSLGLEILTETSLNADDIDILIPEEFVTGCRWNELKSCLENCGYVLIDEAEHTFRKNDIDYSYAAIEGLKDFADIDIADIEIRNKSGIRFMILSLEQYLRVYQKSSQDGYRMNVKEKQDNQKIELIRGKLTASK